MATWTLADIRDKVRKVTGRLSGDELTDKELTEYINKYYQYTFPAEVKLERAHVYYEFLTSANQQTYTYPAGFTNFEPDATLDNLQIEWYQDPVAFDEQNPETYSRETLATGDGSTATFAYTSTGNPIIPGTLVITDDTEVFQDTSTDYTTSDITLTGDQGGTATINLSTGVISVTFATAPASGQAVRLSYIYFVAGRPTAVLLYNNQFKFFPIPNTAYRFKAKAYSNTLVVNSAGTTLTEFTSTSDRPYLDEWGPTIAYGASREIHSDYGEIDAYAEVTALYKEQLAYILKRTHQNLLNTRSTPHF